MFTNYLKVTLRNIVRHKGYSFINITGLALGIAVSFVILLFVVNELTYDRYHKNARNIYRVGATLDAMETHFEVPQVMAPLGPAMAEQFPDVLATGRLYSLSPFVVYQDKKFYEDGVFLADPSIFDILSVEFIHGNPATAFSAPFSLVMTSETARKYFGDDDPIGKVVRIGDSNDFTVTGVVRKPPENTHLKYTMLASFASIYGMPPAGPPVDSWMGFNYRTYAVLKDGASRAEMAEKLTNLVIANSEEMLKQFNAKVAVFLEPITSIHLYSTAMDIDGESRGSLSMVIIFAAIAAFILIIACINFMNLSTARSAERAREVGVRKVLGADRIRLIRQFLGESLVLSLAALVVALLLIELLLPVFNGLIAKDLSYNLVSDWPLSTALVGLTLLVGIVAGSYPALFLSSFQPASSVKGNLRTGRGSRIFRNALVSFQFIISIGLICCTLIISSQLRFIQNKDLGFDKEQLVVVPLRGREARQNRDVLKAKFAALPGVASVAGSSLRLSGEKSLLPVSYAEQPEKQPIAMPVTEVDYDFIGTLKMTLVAGRNFSPDFAADRGGVIVNRAFAYEGGWADPINKIINIQMMEGEGNFVNKPFTVIGMVDDFHSSSLHERITPHVFTLAGNIANLNVRLRGGDIPQTIAAMKTEWEKIVPFRPFTYDFLDDLLDNSYRAEQRLGELFRYFTGLAIFIACLGLFGLASFMAEQRTKEIGVRKVLGATVSGIVMLLSKEFVKWVVIANIIAWPIALYGMNKWLQGYAYRIDIGPASFLLSGLLALGIAVVTVSYQAFKAARANPVESLKYE